MDLNHASGSDFPEWPSEAWTDPFEEETRFRLRLQRLRLGFSLLGLALVVASLLSIGDLILLFAQIHQPMGIVFGIPYFDLALGAVVTWGSLLGVCFLCGPWPDIHWQRRSGILLMMCLADAVLWTLRHANEMGLHDGDIGHSWLRSSLSAAMSWSEFALIASLTADIASHLGDPKANDLSRSAIDLSKSVRSLATTGAVFWFLFFLLQTNWRPPIRPLRPGIFKPGIQQMLFLSWIVLETICFVQTAVLSLLAGRCTAQRLIDMAKADRARDMIPSPSEDGWNEMMGRKSGPNDRP